MAAVAPCPCGAPRTHRARRLCDACVIAAKAADPLRNLDVALLWQLRTRGAPCCRCEAADHDDRGCRGCRCEVAYADHPAREEAEAIRAFRRTDNALAAWTRDWHHRPIGGGS